ncbi:MAG: hypothetical protein VKN72_07615 [Nostocales cyanobacterium 94392]|nr:hypothetical protein [Nostocales cyanobacterium 94392]
MSKDELRQFNIVASQLGISVKNLTKFMNAFDDNNTRYQLLWGWMQDPCVKLKFKPFKSFIRNMKVKNIFDWVDSTGQNKSKIVFVEDFCELS